MIRHKPELIDWPSMTFDKKEGRKNISLAFDILRQEWGVPQLISVDDMLSPMPDEKR